MRKLNQNNTIIGETYMRRRGSFDDPLGLLWSSFAAPLMKIDIYHSRTCGLSKPAVWKEAAWSMAKLWLQYAKSVISLWISDKNHSPENNYAKHLDMDVRELLVSTK